MTRDGLTEENLRDGTVRDISHKSRGRPEDTSETFVPERERKKKASEKADSAKGKRLQNDRIRKSSIRQETMEQTTENAVEAETEKKYLDIVRNSISMKRFLMIRISLARRKASGRSSCKSR